MVQLQLDADDWRAGDRVECPFGPRRLFFPATISRTHSKARSLEVEFDDGLGLMRVRLEDVRECFDPGDTVSLRTSSELDLPPSDREGSIASAPRRGVILKCNRTKGEGQYLV